MQAGFVTGGCAIAIRDPAVEQFLAEHERESAVRTLSLAQKARLAFWVSFLVILVLWDYKITFTVVNSIAITLYIAVIVYKLLTILVTLFGHATLTVTPEELASLRDEDFPLYTVLVPLYHEKEVVGQLLSSITSLDYPKEKLDVKLLVEEDDDETRSALASLTLPPCVEVFIVPDAVPKTKPRACDHGLAAAKGKYVVIYDAEDLPESDQLKKAVAAFRRLDGERRRSLSTFEGLGTRGRVSAGRTVSLRRANETICLQAKLNYYNPRQNILTRWFTIEYWTWFDLFLPGLHLLNTPIPLGGTSNHFKTDVLRTVGGWDPFNVTEDCDLGIRLHAAGYRTRVFESTTWEEANSRLGSWFRQRSRWVKGYIQTHLVHSRTDAGSRSEARRRSPLRHLWVLAPLVLTALLLHRVVLAFTEGGREHVNEALLLAGAIAAVLLISNLFSGVRRLGVSGYAGFLMTVSGLSATLLLNVFYWSMGAAWLYFRWRMWYEDYADDTMRYLSTWSIVSHVFWYATVALLAANGLFVLVHVIACIKRRAPAMLPFAILMPVYWVMMSIGAWRGFFQLFTRAHYWEKTQHGLVTGSFDRAVAGGNGKQ